MRDPRDVILRPVVSEKSYALLDEGAYTFVVHPDANKIEIRQAVEAIFKVLQWIINNAARIFTLIQSLVGAAAQAVAGNIAGVATAVEASLVQIIVVVIDFLTGYLGLGALGGNP